MQDNTPGRRPLSLATGTGLFIALFALLIVREVVKIFLSRATIGGAVCRECFMWASGVALILIIRGGERLPLSSIGLGTSRWWKSILWGVLLSIPCLLLGGALVALTHYGHNQAATAFEKLPLWLVTLIVTRAGVLEELFYRGYAIDRLETLGLGRFWSVTIPLIIFSIGHWTGGWANILIAFALGAILTAFYLWRRDLVANMIGHGLVDFIGNVVPRLFS